MIIPHITKRPTEAWLSGITGGLGLWIVFPSTSMATAGYKMLLEVTSELQWGLMFMFIGLAHFISVLINGMRWWTPFTRAIMSASTAILYATWIYGFWVTNPASTAVFIYICMCVCAMKCFFYSLRDAAEKVEAARNGIYS